MGRGRRKGRRGEGQELWASLSVKLILNIGWQRRGAPGKNKKARTDRKERVLTPAAVSAARKLFQQKDQPRRKQKGKQLSGTQRHTTLNGPNQIVCRKERAEQQTKRTHGHMLTDTHTPTSKELRSADKHCIAHE